MRGLNQINPGNESCFKYLIGAVISVLSNILFKKQKHRIPFDAGFQEFTAGSSVNTDCCTF